MVLVKRDLCGRWAWKRPREILPDHCPYFWCGQLSQVLTFFEDVVPDAAVEFIPCLTQVTQWGRETGFLCKIGNQKVSEVCLFVYFL